MTLERRRPLPPAPGNARRTPGAWLAFGAAATLIALAAFALAGYALHLRGGQDMDAYWNAALRLRSGEALYIPEVANSPTLYRYAPWFAYAWIPLTYLPHDAVHLGWMTVLTAAALGTTLPLARQGVVGWLALAFFLPTQLMGVAYGNVQPLLVAVLLWGAGRRSGPVWIALAASLKAVPLLLILVDIGRGRWRRAGVTAALTALLIVPMLFFDLTHYSVQPGPSQLSLAAYAPWLWVGVAVAVGVVALRLAPGRYRWLAASVAMLAALPRLLTYETSFALVGLVEERGPWATRATAEPDQGSSIAVAAEPS